MSRPPAALLKVTVSSALAAEAQVRSASSAVVTRGFKIRPRIRLALRFIESKAQARRLAVLASALDKVSASGAIVGRLSCCVKGPRRLSRPGRLTRGAARGSLAREIRPEAARAPIASRFATPTRPSGCRREAADAARPHGRARYARAGNGRALDHARRRRQRFRRRAALSDVDALPPHEASHQGSPRFASPHRGA